MYEIIKIDSDYYLTSDDEAYPYALHLNKKEVLKIDGVGELSGELFHSRGFSYKSDCKKIVASTDPNLNIQVLDKNYISTLLSEYIDSWRVKVDVELDNTLKYEIKKINKND